jgi:hypothetical protein
VEAVPPPPAPAGTIYGFFSHVGVNPNSVSFDEVQWFFGKAAAAACKKYHVPGPHPGAVCNEYYIHDLHRQLTLPVTGNVKVSDWHGPDGGVVSPDKPIPYSQVASLVGQPGGDSYLWKMTVKNGYVTSIAGVYRP